MTVAVPPPGGLRLMADSVNPFDIPAGRFPLVAGYTDGAYAWSAAGWAHHAASLRLRICAVHVDPSADACDVESGALTTQQAVQFVVARHNAGRFALVYFSLSRFNQVVSAMHGSGVHDDWWGVWYADWDGQPSLNAGAFGHQYADSVMVGAHYDLSVMADYLPGIDALPQPPASTGAAGTIQGWSGLQGLLSEDLPGFASELGVLASGLQGIG